MKSPKLLFAALLAVILGFAQTARAQNRETSLAVPKERGANLFLTVGPAYMNAKASDLGRSSADLYGAIISFGWRMNKYNKLQIEIGGLAGSDSESYGYNYSNYSLDYIVVPELLTYSFCIPLSRSGRCELRLSPSIGSAFVFTDFKGTYSPPYSSSYYWIHGRDSDLTFAAGVGAGVTIHITPKFMLDVGYRYLRIGKTEYNWGDIDALDTHSVTFLVGWKF
ncbi:MAG: porin family protein [Opitutaceae bacterium]|jgi:opacity protein-like surface antigen|nr:porin family protein [Opitutaceae bacterium]